jgi:quinol monooxygenase YgiN
MYVIIWKYSVHPEHRESFIEYYHADGKWASFFQDAAEYIGSDFFQIEEDKNQFMTIDKWISKESYEQFLENYQQPYLELDKHCDKFTLQEELLGKYFIFE